MAYSGSFFLHCSSNLFPALQSTGITSAKDVMFSYRVYKSR